MRADIELMGGPPQKGKPCTMTLAQPFVVICFRKNEHIRMWYNINSLLWSETFGVLCPWESDTHSLFQNLDHKLKPQFFSYHMEDRPHASVHG